MSRTLHVLVFSKCRPLQLQGYLDSFYCATRFTGRVTVLCPDFRHYEPVISKYTKVEWLLESGNFNDSLRRYANTVPREDAIMPDVDDMVWLRPCNLEDAAEACYGLDGFSLRLGRSVLGSRAEERIEAIPTRHLVWRWAHSTNDWGYPFGLGSTIYNASVIHDILLAYKDAHLSIPNDLESLGIRWVRDTPGWRRLGCFADSDGPAPMFSVAQDLNRVQSRARNKFYGASADELLKAFQDGYRHNWTAMWGKEYPECFAHNADWELIKVQDG